MIFKNLLEIHFFPRGFGFSDISLRNSSHKIFYIESYVEKCIYREDISTKILGYIKEELTFTSVELP